MRDRKQLWREQQEAFALSSVTRVLSLLKWGPDSDAFYTFARTLDGRWVPATSDTHLYRDWHDFNELDFTFAKYLRDGTSEAERY